MVVWAVVSAILASGFVIAAINAGDTGERGTFVFGAVLLSFMAFGAAASLIAGNEWSLAISDESLAWRSPGNNGIVNAAEVEEVFIDFLGGADYMYVRVADQSVYRIERGCCGNTDKLVSALRQMNPELIIKVSEGSFGFPRWATRYKKHGC